MYDLAMQKVNNMKKLALPNYYECIDFDISDVSTNNNKLYWKLLKDVFLR